MTEIQKVVTELEKSEGTGHILVPCNKHVKSFDNVWSWREGNRYDSTTYLFMFEKRPVVKRNWYGKVIKTDYQLYYRFFAGHCVTWTEYKYDKNLKHRSANSGLPTRLELDLCDIEKSVVSKEKHKDLPNFLVCKNQEMVNCILVGDYKEAKRLIEEQIVVETLRGNYD